MDSVISPKMGDNGCGDIGIGDGVQDTLGLQHGLDHIHNITGKMLNGR